MNLFMLILKIISGLIGLLIFIFYLIKTFFNKDDFFIEVIDKSISMSFISFNNSIPSTSQRFPKYELKIKHDKEIIHMSIFLNDKNIGDYFDDKEINIKIKNIKQVNVYKIQYKKKYMFINIKHIFYFKLKNSKIEKYSRFDHLIKKI